MRIKALLRRNLKKQESSILIDNNVISYKDITINISSHEVKKSDSIITLTSKEFQILKLLVSNPGRVYPAKNIYEIVWEEEFLANDRSILTHMGNIREKLGDSIQKSEYIKTIWGVGYKVEKKIFNTLYANIIIIFIFSFGLTISTFAFLSAFFYGLDIPIVNSKKIEKTFINEWNHNITQVNSFDTEEKINIYINHIPIQTTSRLFIQDTYYAHVTADGEILSANGSIILINNPSISSEYISGYISTSTSNVEKGDEIIETIIFIAEEIQTVTNPNLLEYRFKKIIMLDDGTYLLGYYIHNFALTSLLFGLVIFIFYFALLFKGRLNYLISIQKAIKKVSYVDTYEPLPLKYKNELRDIANEVNTVAKLLKEKRDEERAFLLNISHDLRTPLNSILGFANLIKKNTNLSQQKRQKYIDYVINKSKYLETMLTQFFKFARVKWNNSKVDKQKIHIQELIAQIFEGYLPEFKNYNLDFQFDFENPPVYLFVDVPLFMRAIHNIVSNAIKYSKENTIIKAIVKSTHHIITIEICNVSKTDVNKINIDKIFDRFFKNDISRTDEGAGLGLSIAKAIIEQHNGQITTKIKNDKISFIIKLVDNY